MKPIIAITLAFGILALIFLLQNLGGAELGILFLDVDLPLSLWVVAFYALGALTGRPLWRFLKDLRYR